MWKKTKTGWVRGGKNNKTFGGVSRETAEKTNNKINEHARWSKLTPLQRAKEIEKRKP